MSTADIKLERVLQGAAEVFLKQGFTAATTDMIQKAAGVSKATVYTRYPNKQALFSAVIERQCHLLTQQVTECLPQHSDIFVTLTEVGTRYLTLILSPEGMALYRTIIAESPRFPELGRAFYLAGPKVVLDQVTEYITDAAGKGQLDIQPVGARAAATLFLSLLRGDGQLQCLTHPDFSPTEILIDEWVNLAMITFRQAYSKPTKS
ncbi:TetR/AcrR family transcriptional regulator [Vibrio tritonius]|uniref:TetR/AcrR family transcriptional regulator n=1 Tax=Vibrio tritonius TaxID=1435069 RepID=A0ABS7YN97_9VIBR|nr:TetR/AcrR family transcriptional regulator [Vibrio tritonius]MCA2016828.1 TetR/AcrR family transcriptional regulator [Vibrio tritonius]